MTLEWGGVGLVDDVCAITGVAVVEGEVFVRRSPERELGGSPCRGAEERVCDEVGWLLDFR